MLPLPSDAALERLSPFLAPLRPLAARVLDRVLRAGLDRGTLETLDGRVVCVECEGLPPLRLEVAAGHLRSARDLRPPEVRIRSDLAGYLELMTRSVDADTLFFQRRLSVRGDTELGLQVKNILDRFDHERLPAPLHRSLTLLGQQARRGAYRPQV